MIDLDSVNLTLSFTCVYSFCKYYNNYSLLTPDNFSIPDTFYGKSLYVKRSRHKIYTRRICQP